MNLENIAKKVVAYRQLNNLTIAQMAEQTELSTALISQIERQLANPSLSVLEILAKTLGITISELFEEEIDEESLVLRRKERERIYYKSNHQKTYHYILTPEPMKSSIRVAYVHLAPLSESLDGDYFSHKNDEIVYVLSGTVVTCYEQSQIELYSGDTLRIPANKKHRYCNETNEPVKILTIKSSRNF